MLTQQPSPPAAQDTSPHCACRRNLNCPESCQEMNDMPTVIKTSVKSLGSGELCYLAWEREVQAKEGTQVTPSLI